MPAPVAPVVALQPEPGKPVLPPPGGRGPDALARELQIPLDLPTPERVFRVESEAALRERIRQEARQRNERAEFPREVTLVPPGQAYAGRLWPLQSTTVVPHAVCYNPLYFEDLNTERYGWSVCVFQPLISTGKFYADVVALPYKMGVTPPWSCEYNTGYYLPGDPVPYMIYVPPLDLAGAALQTAVVLGGIAIFP
jgi:hypothetical protein